MTVHDPVHALVRDHDHVVTRRQVAGAHVLVIQPVELELELLEQPARPAFVHARLVAHVDADARRLQRRRIAQRQVGASHDDAKRRHLCRCARSADNERPCREVETVVLDRTTQARHRNASFEQPIHRKKGVVGIAADQECLRFGFKLRRGQLDLVDLFQLRLERTLDLHGVHAHQQRQCLRGHVVRPLRGSAGILAQVGIMLAFEQRLGVATVGLRELDDVRAGAVRRTIGSEVRFRALHFHHTEAQRVEHLHRGRRILLVGRDHERVRPAAALHLVFAQPIEIAHVLQAVLRDVMQHLFVSDQLVVHDVAQVPLAALPRIGEIPRRALRVVAERVGIEVLEADARGRREARRRRLRQDAQPAVIRLVMSRRAPEVVHRVDRDAALAG